MHGERKERGVDVHTVGFGDCQLVLLRLKRDLEFCVFLPQHVKLIDCLV